MLLTPKFPMTEVKCHSCGSTQLTAGQKGFGLGKAAVGGIALGPVGLLGGFVGSKKVMITCLACGDTWEAGGPKPHKMSKGQEHFIMWMWLASILFLVGICSGIVK